jgi:hypothetical protein
MNCARCSLLYTHVWTADAFQGRVGSNMPEKVALTYLFFAYAAAFAILVGYVTRTAWGTRRLREEVQRLREQVRALEEGTPGDEASPPQASGGAGPASSLR